ncbi:MAG: hypothetical protein ACT6FF_09485 [Methanosarcinaceae archaeon]
MAEETKQYRRKVSAEEVQEAYILVLKDSLKFFPKIDKRFQLKVDQEEHEAYVEAYDCWCMGPRKPHVHYRISIRKFRGKFPIRRNSVVTFTKIDDNKYSLSK